MAKPIIDLLLRNANIYNVFLRKFMKGDVSISQGRFFTVGTYDLTGYEIRQEVDAEGRTLVPGLVDIHLHVESSLVTPMLFGREMVRHGVTTVVADPHEIGNVFGVEGIEAMINAGEGSPCDIFYGIPSCIPATPFETTGGAIHLPDFERLRNKALCLGEVMSYVQLVREDGTPLHDLLAGIRHKYPRTIIEGHCPNFTGLDLATFVYYGPDSDHTLMNPSLIDERVRLGMMVQIQEKSMTPEVLSHLGHAGYDEHICMVTDDVSPDTLVYKGHLDHLIRLAIAGGVSPERALYWTTYTPCRRMHLLDRGSIAPGKLADFVILEDLASFRIREVYKAGNVVHRAGMPEACNGSSSTASGFPDEYSKSIRLSPLTMADFDIAALPGADLVSCRAMLTNTRTTFTEEVSLDLPVEASKVRWAGSGWALIAVFNRHGGNSNRGYGLVGGAVLKRGAVASSYAHDSHNLLVIGHSAEEMAYAANRVISRQGGICVVEGSKVLAEVALPIAGLMAHEPVAALASKLEAVAQALKCLGYDHRAPVMSVATLSLAVSPELKLTDFGLVDVKNKKLVPLIKEVG